MNYHPVDPVHVLVFLTGQEKQSCTDKKEACVVSVHACGSWTEGRHHELHTRSLGK